MHYTYHKMGKIIQLHERKNGRGNNQNKYTSNKYEQYMHILQYALNKKCSKRKYFKI